MTDIAKQWDGYTADFLLGAGGFETSADLDTALINSLFTHRRAEADDELPPGASSRGGYFGDTLEIDAGRDRIGSRLWLLVREKQTPDTLNRAREYAVEALQWLVEDGVAQSVEVTAEWVRQGVLGLTAEIVRPDGVTETRNYDFAWDQLG